MVFQGPGGWYYTSSAGYTLGPYPTQAVAQAQAAAAPNPSFGGSAVPAPQPAPAAPTTPAMQAPAMVKPEPAAPGYLPSNYNQLSPEQRRAAETAARNGADPNSGYFDYTGKWVLTETDDEDFNAAAETAANNAATIAYNNKRLELIDQPTLEIEKDRLALEAAKFAWDQEMQRQRLGLDVLQLAGELRGPRNAFQQQAVISGLNQQGYSNAIDAIAGLTNLPSFQAPQAAPEPVTLATLAEDIKNGGWVPTPTAAPATERAGAGVPGAVAGTAGGAGTGMAATQRALALTPTGQPSALTALPGFTPLLPQSPPAPEDMLPIPSFATGGTVPGWPGEPKLILAHGGETVLPTAQPRGPLPTLPATMPGPAWGSGDRRAPIPARGSVPTSNVPTSRMALETTGASGSSGSLSALAAALGPGGTPTPATPFIGQGGLTSGALLYQPIAGYSRESGGRTTNPFLLYADPEQGGQALLYQNAPVGHLVSEQYKRHLAQTYGNRFDAARYDADLAAGATLLNAAKGAVSWTPPPPSAAEIARQAAIDALPNPNKIVGREFLGLSPDTQQFLLSGFEAKGYSGNDVLDTIRKTLPQFSIPATMGTIRA